MRRTILAAVAVLAIGGATTWAIWSWMLASLADRFVSL